MYRTLLADRRVLVVLDDAADGAQVRDLIPAHPGCAVLVTARQRLPDVGGAHHVAPLEPLAAEPTRPSCSCGVVRGRRHRPERRPRGGGRVVALCGGLPLALRIAGALRVHDHPRPTSELADRLARQGLTAFAYGELQRRPDHRRRLRPARRRRAAAVPRARPAAAADFGLWTAAALLDAAGRRRRPRRCPQLAASYMIEPVEPRSATASTT